MTRRKERLSHGFMCDRYVRVWAALCVQCAVWPGMRWVAPRALARLMLRCAVSCALRLAGGGGVGGAWVPPEPNRSRKETGTGFWLGEGRATDQVSSSHFQATFENLSSSHSTHNSNSRFGYLPTNPIRIRSTHPYQTLLECAISIKIFPQELCQEHHSHAASTTHQQKSASQAR